jgi:hypothetical protein
MPKIKMAINQKENYMTQLVQRDGVIPIDNS